MEPAPNQEVGSVAPVPKPRKGPKYVTRNHNINKAAIAAAAIAAVTLSTSVRRRRRISRTPERGSRSSLKDSLATEVRPQRRRNRNRADPALCDAASPECKHPGCNCQFLASSKEAKCCYARSSCSSDSSSGEKTCLYCVQKLTEENKCLCCENCEGAAQNVPREVQPYAMRQHCGCCPQPQPSEQQCQYFARNPVCYALHECCREHQSPSYPNDRSLVPPVGYCCSAVPSACPENSPFKACCVQRMRHGINPSPTASNSNICRKKHIHPQMASCDCHPQYSPPLTPVRTIKALKPAKPRPRDQRVQARRIRHPACDEDSNSETELCAPVVDVRALRTPTRSSTSSSLAQARPFLNYPARLVPDVRKSSSSSSPVAGGPAKLYSCPGPSSLVNTFLATTPALPNIPAAFPMTGAVPRVGKDSTSSSSDSSKTSEIPGTLSSTSNFNSSTDLSDSSTSSNVESRTPTRIPRYPYPPMAVPSLSNSQSLQANASLPRNPIHTFYQNPLINPASSRRTGTPLPISSGDYWNVRRPWPRSERRTSVPVYAARMAREGDNQAAQWRWTAQPSTSNPVVQQPRDVRREWEQHRYNT